MFKFVEKLSTEFASRLNYSIVHMTLPQWGIVTVVALAIGIVLLKAKR